jgi:hypothetical protein
MFKRGYTIPMKDTQLLRLVPIGDVHFDTNECDRERLKRFVEWVGAQEKKGHIVRLMGLGDMLDFLSPSNRSRLRGAELYETARKNIEQRMWENLKEFVSFVAPLNGKWLGLVTGHHHYIFGDQKLSGRWLGRSSDEWISRQFGGDYWGEGVALVRLRLPHAQRLDVLVYHGSGGAQTPGGRVQKRIRFAEIAPTAHLVITGHDNAKLAYPRSGLDYDHGKIKRYVIGSGSFQRAYLEGEAGYAERGGLTPADLGVSVIDIAVEQRDGKWRPDYHVSV